MAANVSERPAMAVRIAPIVTADGSMQFREIPFLQRGEPLIFEGNTRGNIHDIFQAIPEAREEWAMNRIVTHAMQERTQPPDGVTTGEYFHPVGLSYTDEDGEPYAESHFYYVYSPAKNELTVRAVKQKDLIGANVASSPDDAIKGQKAPAMRTIS